MPFKKLTEHDERVWFAFLVGGVDRWSAKITPASQASLRWGEKPKYFFNRRDVTNTILKFQRRGMIDFHYRPNPREKWKDKNPWTSRPTTAPASCSPSPTAT